MQDLIEKGLNKIQPMLIQGGQKVERLGVEDGIAKIRLHGSRRPATPEAVPNK
jgi:hypothetical protein